MTTTEKLDTHRKALTVNLDCWIDFGIVPTGAGHLLGRCRGHVHDCDEERRVDKQNRGEGQ
jgi:hypothetical protein